MGWTFILWDNREVGKTVHEGGHCTVRSILLRRPHQEGRTVRVCSLAKTLLVVNLIESTIPQGVLYPADESFKDLCTPTVIRSPKLSSTFTKSDST